MTSFPKVTVVTVVFNLIKAGRRDYFRQCVESVHNQTYGNIEHLVIDGASTDGTVDLLREYAGRGWIKYLSEPDSGIYNAMNKGIRMASGKYTVFLNSDDFFHNINFVSENVKYLEKKKADFSYSEHINVTANGDFINIRTTNIGTFYLRMPFSHQSMFTKTDVLKELGYFNENLRLAADYEMVVNCFLNRKKGVQVPCCGVSFRVEGATTQQQSKSLEETADIMQRYFDNRFPKREYINFLQQLTYPRDVYQKIRSMVSSDVARKMDKSVAAKTFKRDILKIVRYPKTTSKRKVFWWLTAGENVTQVRYYLFGCIKIWSINKKTKDKRPRILVITRDIFWDNGTVNGSQVYLLATIKGLREYFAVDFCSLSDALWQKSYKFDRKYIYPDFCYGYIKKNRDKFVRQDKPLRHTINFLSFLLKLKHPHHSTRQIKKLLRYKLLGLGGNPYYIRLLNKSELAFVSAILRRNRYDAVLCSYVYTSNVFDLPETTQVKHKIILTHDIVYQRREMFLKNKLPAQTLSQWTREKEVSCWNKADILLAIQKSEADEMQQLLPQKKVLNFPLIQTPVPEAKKFSEIGKEIACFASNNDVNRESLKWFLQDVFPLVLQKHPDAVLKVYGGISLDEYANPHVIFAGRINDVKNGYVSARLSIAPLIAGSGLKIKVIESFANATPVVGTSVAFQGIEDASGFCGFMADGTAFAEDIVRLLTDDDLCQKMSEQCLEYIRLNFSVKSVAEPLFIYCTSHQEKEND